MQATGDAPLTTPAPAAPTAVRPTRRALVALVAVAVVAVDVATKTWIVRDYRDGRVTHLVRGVLDIEQSRNPGAAFNLATGGTILLSLVAAAVVVVIGRVSRGLRSGGWALALGLLLGGALGNLGDRVFRSPGLLRGEVVDWIYLHHWPVFNVADSGITIGGLLAVVLAARGFRLDGTRERR